MHAAGKGKLITDMLFSRFFAAICFVVLASVVAGIAKGLYKRHQINDRIVQLRTEIASYEQKNQEYTQLVAYLQSPEFIESEAKLKYGMKKKGEYAVIIPNARAAAPAPVSVQDDRRSNPQLWMTYFFGSR